MLILIPWKPVVIVWGLLSALIFIGYVESSLRKGISPFGVDSIKTTQIDARHTAAHAASQPKHTHKAATATSQ
jgi:hypothetical protein